MEYKYSTEEHPSTYDTEGLCDGIPVRRNVAADLEEIGTFRAQEDWRQHVGPLGGYKGGLGPRYSFMTVSVPECLPDRLEIISYANELAFLHDDITDNVSKEEGDVANDEMMHAFHEAASKGDIQGASGKRLMQAKILKEMLAIDKPRALVAMKSWAKFVESASGREHHDFKSLDEYIPYRSFDVGQLFWHALLTFGCALTIPDEEADLCRELMIPTWIAASLTNDLFSFQKEYDDAKKIGQPYVVNAVWVLMQEKRVPEEEAKLECRKRIKEEIKKANKNAELVKEMEVSEDLKRYIELLRYSLSGNVVWSLQCPRYHKNIPYNGLQLQRAKHGIAKFPARWPPKEQNDLPAEESANPTILNGTNQLNGVGSPADSPKLNDFAVDGLPTNGARSPLIPNGVKTSTGNDQSWKGNSVKHTDDVILNTKLPDLSDQIVEEPFKYVSSLPSKGVREHVIDAINAWLKLPPQPLVTIKKVVQMLHNASLMLDDIEDTSPLRRGKPSTHEIYGGSQTVNSATYEIIQSADKARTLANPSSSWIFFEEVRRLFVGQSHDLYWVYNVACPSVADYLRMIDDKTGGLFRMITRLMTAESPPGIKPNLDTLACLLGRYFQIRDDYMNLFSPDYTKAKGFCEDLDEGKYSLPLIHALQARSPHNPLLPSPPNSPNHPNYSPLTDNNTIHNTQLQSLLIKRRLHGSLAFEQKQLVLAHMQHAGSLEFTRGVLEALYSELEGEMGRLEGEFGVGVLELRRVVEKLKV